MEVASLRKILRHVGHWDRIRKHVHTLEEREGRGQGSYTKAGAATSRRVQREVSKALLPFVTLAIDTGARYDTIRTLQWERVDLQRGNIEIGKDKTPPGTGRTVLLNARALGTLQFWASQFPDRKPKDYVFPVALYGLHGEKAGSAARFVRTTSSLPGPWAPSNRRGRARNGGRNDAAPRVPTASW